MTHIGNKIYASDGSSEITIVDTDQNLKTTKISVTYEQKPITNLNELEYCGKEGDGLIYANVWFSDFIYAIDPTSGQVLKAFNLASLKQAESLLQTTYFNHNRGDVLNGIAYVASEDAFYVTGKLWNLMFKLRFK